MKKKINLIALILSIIFISVKARILPPLRWGMNRLLVTVLTHN